MKRIILSDVIRLSESDGVLRSSLKERTHPEPGVFFILNGVPGGAPFIFPPDIVRQSR